MPIPERYVMLLSQIVVAQGKALEDKGVTVTSRTPENRGHNPRSTQPPL